MNYVSLIVFLTLLWIRPEYRFLLFYVIANTVLGVLFVIGSIRPDDVPILAVIVAINDAILLLIGALVVALRKWIKGRDDRRAERFVAEARAEAARQQQ
ncbi:MAG: hypothetical protein WAU68_00545 [Vitreimonas sp.]